MPKFRGPNVPDRFQYPELFDAGNTDMDGKIVQKNSRYDLSPCSLTNANLHDKKTMVVHQRHVKSVQFYNDIKLQRQEPHFGTRIRPSINTAVNIAYSSHTLYRRKEATRLCRCASGISRSP